MGPGGRGEVGGLAENFPQFLEWGRRQAGGRDGEGAGAGVTASGWEGKAGVRVCAVGSAGLGLTARPGSARSTLHRRHGAPPSRTLAKVGGGDGRRPGPGPSLSPHHPTPGPLVPQVLWPPGRIHALSDSAASSPVLGGRPWAFTLFH